MDEGDRHFGRDNEVFKTLCKIARRLDDLDIPYAIVGGLALDAHGYRRMTVDVDLLVTPDGLQRIWDGLDGFEPDSGPRRVRSADVLRSRAAAKNVRTADPTMTIGGVGLRDVENGVRVDLFVTGQFPGDGKPKPVAFPDPAGAATRIDGIAYLTLPKLVELKLASGMTGGVTRLKDLADVVALIETLALPAEFAEGLDPYVRPKYLELWEGIRQSPPGPDIA
jgi:hypothetical protein